MIEGRYLYAEHISVPDAEKSASIRRIINASLFAVEPAQAIYQSLHRQQNLLVIGEKEYDLNLFNRILVVSVGKAAGLMAQATAQILGDRIHTGVTVLKYALSSSECSLPSMFQVWYGNHPVPGDNSLIAGTAILKFLESCKSDDLVLFLISGGGSALITSPVEGVSLADLKEITSLLLECGAQIDEINTIRKHLDVIKGGGLAKAAHPAVIVTLVLSDVVGNPLDMIASGPTVADTTTFKESMAILEKYHLIKSTPASILDRIKKGCAQAVPETPKPDDVIFINSHTGIIGSNYQAATAGMIAAQLEGYKGGILTTYLQGDAYGAGRFLGGILRQISETGQPYTRPVCLIAGGETTVKVSGKGLGGRNLEVALGAAQEMAGLEKVVFVTLATDGEDGPTDSAGAIVTGETLHRARVKGIHLETFHQNNDSYHFFEPLGALIKTGPTGTNVNDLNFLFAF